jgi:Bax protein
MKQLIRQIARPIAILSLLLIASVAALFAGAFVDQRQQADTVISYEAPSFTLAMEPISVFPDFDSFSDVDIKKQFFFDFIELYVRAQNEAISQQRGRLLEIAPISIEGSELSNFELNQILDFAAAYRIDADGLSNAQVIHELLKRVDIVPISVALAQAATESAWGTSRFAIEGNNIFGQWCFDPGCGLVPSSRASSDTHEVRSFENIESAVQGYFINLNTHPSYEYFRELRAQMRGEKGTLEPLLLAHGLGTYSIRGQRYVDEILIIMKQNDLMNRDTIYPNSLEPIIPGSPD